MAGAFRYADFPVFCQPRGIRFRTRDAEIIYQLLRVRNYFSHPSAGVPPVVPRFWNPFVRRAGQASKSGRGTALRLHGLWPRSLSWPVEELDANE